jgi:hypothetical protein
MMRMLVVALTAAALTMGCGKKKESPTDVKSESKTSSSDKKKDDKKVEKTEEKKDTPSASAGDELGTDIPECVDWEKKLTSCEVLAKTAPSLLTATKKVWKIKSYSKSDIKDDCVKRIESLPSVCRK